MRGDGGGGSVLEHRFLGGWGAGLLFLVACSKKTILFATLVCSVAQHLLRINLKVIFFMLFLLLS